MTIADGWNQDWNHYSGSRYRGGSCDSSPRKSMDDDLFNILTVDDDDLRRDWERVLGRLEERFDPDLTIEAVLFLIGIQSRGRGFQPDLKRESKQDLIMEGTYCVFEKLGIYERAVTDEGGTSLWNQKISLPRLPIDDQEKLLRIGIIQFFDDEL
jgi:hypothetical protein